MTHATSPKKRVIFFLALCTLLTLWLPRASHAEKHFDTDDHLSPSEKEEDPLLTLWNGKLRVGALLELTYEYADISDTGNRRGQKADDLFLDTLELALTARPTAWFSATIAGGIETIGKKGEHSRDFLDEATARITLPGLPIYLICGKRAQPFGRFEDPMISGTLTEDLYEIIETGATVGFSPRPHTLDLSLTYYEGENIIHNLSDFDTHELKENRSSNDHNGAWIANLSLEPLRESLFFHTFFNSEPGEGRRNETIGGAITIHCNGVTLDVEFTEALSRESPQNEEEESDEESESHPDDNEHLETAWTAGISWIPVDLLELAARYESFDDDTKGQQDEVVNVRYLAGLNLFPEERATFSLEYRYTDFEREKGSEAVKSLNEITMQISLEW